MTRRLPGTGRLTAVAAALVVALGAPASAQDAEVLDVLAGADTPRPSASDIASSVRRLEPEVRLLELPDPRSLREEREDAGQTTVSLSADVLFPFDSAEVTDGARTTLEALAAELAETEGTIAVVGHTDSVGTEEYNQQLSENRADAVAEVLREHLGDREITTEGRSFREPIARESDDDPAAAAQNRRVEISFAS